MTTDL